MGEAARDDDDVVTDLSDYLRETLKRMDQIISGYAADRHEMAVRLAAIDAAGSEAVLEAAADFERRVAEDRGYEKARDAQAVIGDAARRYVQPR